MSGKTWVTALPRRVGQRLLFAAALSGIGAITAPASALPAQSWNGYRWSRTGPLAITLGSNVSTVWQPYVDAAATEWSTANNIDFVQKAGASTAAGCGAVYGTVQVCSSNYGFNGWLGYAQVWLSNGFIVQATVKLNDSYFAAAKYNTTAWREAVSCQEIGHTLGLAHTNTIRTNLNTGSCMDYTNDPTGTAGGANGTLANTAPDSTDFAALDGIYANLDATQLSYTRPQFVTGDPLSIGDDIDAAPRAVVPEPSVWAMLILGFGLVGSAMRRRTTTRCVAT